METNFKHLDLRYLKRESLGKKDIEKNMLEVFILQLNKFSKEFTTLAESSKWYLLGSEAFFAKETIRIYGLHEMANSLNRLDHLCRSISKNEGIHLSSSVAVPLTFDEASQLPPSPKEVLEIVNKFKEVSKETIEEVKRALEDYQ